MPPEYKPSLLDSIDSATRLAVMESELKSFRESVDSDFLETRRILAELHDKIDTHIVSQADRVARLEERERAQNDKSENLKKEIESTNHKIWKISGVFATISSAIIGGLFEYFSKK